MGIVAEVKSRVKHTPLVRLFLRRRFHAFCLGPPKTGTTSVSEMLKLRHRAEHEPLQAGTMDLVRAAHAGTLTPADASRSLRWRDRELYLEMESSHPMTVFAATLAETFPDAKFVLIVREPRAWLDSIINMRLNKAVHRFEPRARTATGQFFRELNHLYFRDRYPDHGAGETELGELGLFTLDGYLDGWARHYRTVLDGVPSNRLLVMRIDELGSAPERLASFLGIAAEDLDSERSHSHRAPARHDVLDRIDGRLLEAKIERHCAETLERLTRALESNG